MTDALTRWTSRQNQVVRGLLWFVGLTGALFLFGFFVGFGVAAIEKGRFPQSPWSYVAIAAAILAVIGFAVLLKALRHGQPAETAYERRYNRAILAFGGIGGLIGLTFSLVKLTGGNEPENLSFDWIAQGVAFSPLAAIVVATVLLVGLGGSVVWYHRIIDDHEERSALWGSTFGYFFMLLVVPCWLILAAGGLLPAMTGGIALALVLASSVLQAAVWAWFKYR